MTVRRGGLRRIGTAAARVGLAALTLIVTVNLWTGFPLLALWLGSQATGGEILNMTGVVVTMGALVVLMSLGGHVLTRISRAYDRVTGRPPPSRQPAPWLLSMSASRVQPATRRHALNAVEMIVIGGVVTAFVLFEVWFFFFASATI